MQVQITALAERVVRSLDLAEQVVRTLLDAPPRIDLAALESPPDKVIAETALLLRAVSAIPDRLVPNLAARVRRVAELLVPHARSTRVRVSIVLHPALARDYAMAHQCLSAIGLYDHDFDALLCKALDAPQAAGRERVPHRELEQAWVESLCGSPVSADLISRTALARGIDVLTGSRDDIYALTHAALYAADLGLRPVELPRPPRALAAEADSALAGALDDDDFDLAGELIMLWPLLRLPWSAASRYGAVLLGAIEDDIGLLPSLAIDGDHLRQYQGEARQQYAMATSYHTAYVMGLLSAMIIRDSTAASSGVVDRMPDVLHEAMRALEELPHRPVWHSHFRTLPERWQEQLAVFALDVAIRRAVRRMDLGIVHRLVVVACGGEVVSAAVQQAIGLLDRVQSLKLDPHAV